MATEYQFRFNAQAAEESEYYFSVIYGGPETRIAESTFTGTLKAAIEAFKAFAEAQSVTCYCSIHCRANPLPRGFKQIESIKVYRDAVSTEAQ